eukprot:6459462-Alexandrium_andersonii.AAC.1
MCPASCRGSTLTVHAGAWADVQDACVCACVCAVRPRVCVRGLGQSFTFAKWHAPTFAVPGFGTCRQAIHRHAGSSRTSRATKITHVGAHFRQVQRAINILLWC